MPFTVIIPARYASTRLPGKVLKDIGGKTMLHRVCLCARSSGADTIIVATDDRRVAEEAHRIGVDVCLTSSQHESGTQRISEVLTTRSIDDDTIIVNVQGDEPFLPAACIDQVANLLAEDESADMATLYTPLTTPAEVFDSNVVKLVVNQDQHAMYFSRAPIPWHRDEWPAGDNASYHVTPPILDSMFRHIGLYAYRARFVHQYIAYPPSRLEHIEKLEQLRALWYGHRIKTAAAVAVPGPGIDSPGDLEAAEARVKLQETDDCQGL